MFRLRFKLFKHDIIRAGVYWQWFVFSASQSRILGDRAVLINVHENLTRSPSLRKMVHSLHIVTSVLFLKNVEIGANLFPNSSDFSKTRLSSEGLFRSLLRLDTRLGAKRSMFFTLSITVINCIWIRFTSHPNWIRCIFIVLTSISCDFMRCWNCRLILFLIV
jgi:hypothetical protein